jgi:hypothetical protein
MVANDALCQETLIWRALGSRLRSKTVQFRRARRELPHNFRGAGSLGFQVLSLPAFWLVLAPLYCSGPINRNGVNRAANCFECGITEGLGWQVVNSQGDQMPCPIGASLVTGKAPGAFPKLMKPISPSRCCAEIGTMP